MIGNPSPVCTRIVCCPSKGRLAPGYSRPSGRCAGRREANRDGEGDEDAGECEPFLGPEHPEVVVSTSAAHRQREEHDDTRGETTNTAEDAPRHVWAALAVILRIMQATPAVSDCYVGISESVSEMFTRIRAHFSGKGARCVCCFFRASSQPGPFVLRSRAGGYFLSSAAHPLLVGCLYQKYFTAIVNLPRKKEVASERK